MKIDTSKIEGFSEMTAEQKLAALESYDIAEPDFSGLIKKEVFDKTASELASVKKQLREKMSADELAVKEDAEKREKLETEYNNLLKKVSVSENKSKLLGLGYDETLAGETAEAMVNGELDKVFQNQKKHLDLLEKKIRADVLKETPKPGSDSIQGATDYRAKIDEAQKNRDLSAVAYYTRLEAQQESLTKQN